MANYSHGLPSPSSYFTYYINDTGWIEYRNQYNTEKFNTARDALFSSVGGKAKVGGWISNINKFQLATQFVKKVAENEQQKELEAVRKFCNKYKGEFPILEMKLSNPKKIINDPIDFYTELITAINRMRKGTKEYYDELKQMQTRIQLAQDAIKQGQKRNLGNYKIEEYRYRTEVTSFIHRLSGRYTLRTGDEILDKNSVKIEKLVMQILNELKITEKVTSGEDFAAIAASVYFDIEKKLQEEYNFNDEYIHIPVQDRLKKILDEIGEEITSHYIQTVKNHDTVATNVQEALQDINGTTYARVITNVKDILGITTETDPEKLKKIDKRFKTIENTTTQESAPIRRFVSHMRSKLNNTLEKDIRHVNITISGSKDTQHGTINEAIAAVVEKYSAKGGKVLGTDLFTLGIDYSINNSELDKLFQSFLSEFTAEMKAMSDKLDPTKNNFKRDAHHRNTVNELQQMNFNLTAILKQMEEKMAKFDELENEKLFVYHESLKLYSSMETGNRNKNEGFHGRTMDILSYIDSIYSAQSSMNFLSRISRDDMAFLALNIQPKAAAENYAGPLETFFSTFAGMVMFDDIANLAEEAVKQIGAQNTISQVHLYNLNGIYVPASFVLNYVGSESQKMTQELDSGYGAIAKITINKSNSTYEHYKSSVGDKISNKNDEYYLTAGLWEAVANENAQHTKISISFLKSFTKLIEQLSK